MYKLKKRFKNEKGQGMVEYGLILALVSIVAILGLSTLGGSIKGQLEGIADSIGGISEPGQGPGYSDEEIDDLITNHNFIPVATAEDLNNVRSDETRIYGEGTKWRGTYEGGLDKKYIQVADIDLSGIDDFEPIGKTDDANSFKGTFDGGGYVISNLTINKRSEEYVGLFGRATGATFKNIGLVNVNVAGANNTGGLVGRQWSSSVTDSYATGSVTGRHYVGGLIGQQSNGSSVSDSYATGNVTGTGSRVGGLVGVQDRSSVTNSYATGSVTGSNNTGGLVGGQNISSVSNSYATGSVNGTVNYTGGLVGAQSSSSVTNSYYDTETTGQSDTGTKGTGKTTAGMKNKGTYTDWDNTIWEIADGQYPTLR